MGWKWFRWGQTAEAKWLAATDPVPMLKLLKGKASDRKLRMFGCACCRRIYHLLTSDRSRTAVEVAEDYADGLATKAKIVEIGSSVFATIELLSVEANQNAERAVCFLCLETPSRDASESAHFVLRISAVAMAQHLHSISEHSTFFGNHLEPEETEQIRLLRDIFGNPFRPVTLDRSWLTSTVLSLANGIYNDKAFDLLPILADALQDAGCDNEDILSHCRGPGPHCRGCFVVDLLLQKA